MLMGNDDKFASDATLEVIHQAIRDNLPVAAVITNYREITTGRVFRRILRDGIVGAGVETAAKTYRNYAFVSGLVLRREDAIAARTEEWDGAEMYQMFIGSRAIASGGRLLGLTEVAVLKDIQIVGVQVDTYRNRRVVYCDHITERVLPVSELPAVVWNAIAPLAEPGDRPKLAWSILRQMLLYTYPYWMVELRRVHSFRYAFEVCLGMRCRHLTRRMEVPWSVRLATRLLHAALSVVGLLFPLVVFDKLSPWLHKLAKRRSDPAKPGRRSRFKGGTAATKPHA